MKNYVNCKLVCTDKKFVNDTTKEEVSYVETKLVINGEEISVSVKKEDKRYFEFLRKSFVEVK